MRQLEPGFTPEAYGFTSVKAMVTACGTRVRTRQAKGDQELSLA